MARSRSRHSPASVATDMVSMMTKVVEEGTAKRALARRHQGRRQDRHHQRLPRCLVRRLHRQLSFAASGSATMITRRRNQMTGGSLPAQTWHEIMAYAHQGVELRPIPLLGGGGRPVVSEARREGGAPEGGRPSILTRRATEALLRVERLLDDATRALATGREPSKTTDARDAPIRQEATAATPDRAPPVPRN